MFFKKVKVYLFNELFKPGKNWKYWENDNLKIYVKEHKFSLTGKISYDLKNLSFEADGIIDHHYMSGKAKCKSLAGDFQLKLKDLTYTIEFKDCYLMVDQDNCHYKFKSRVS